MICTTEASLVETLNERDCLDDGGFDNYDDNTFVHAVFMNFLHNVPT